MKNIYRAFLVNEILFKVPSFINMCVVSLVIIPYWGGGLFHYNHVCVPVPEYFQANNKYSGKMHGWLYSCLAGVNFVESLIFQRRGESLYHTCSLYDKWYPAMLFLTLVVMAYWGASG